MPTKTKAQLEVEISLLEEQNADLFERNAELRDQLMYSDKPEKPPWVGIALLAAVVLILGGIATGVQRADHYYDKSDCYKFAAYTQHNAKFVDYNPFDWDCLLQTRGGTWINKDNLGATEVTLPLTAHQ